MQYYSQFEQSLWGRSAVAAVLWAFLYFRHRKLISQNTMISILFVWNIVTIIECIDHPTNVISVALLLQSILTKNKVSKLVISLILIASFPVYTPLLVLSILIRYSQNKWQFNVGKILSTLFCFLGLLSIFHIHDGAYFSKQFSPHSGVTWILFSHMFQRYLLLYQTITIISPFLVILPLHFSQAPTHSKLAVQWLVCIYFMTDTTLIHIWFLYLLQILLYRQVMIKITKRKQIIWNALTVMAVLLSIASYIFYHRLIRIWTSTHLISMGYILIQILLFWGAHSVYLSQSLTILDESTQERPKPKLLIRIKQYIMKRLQEM